MKNQHVFSGNPLQVAADAQLAKAREEVGQLAGAELSSVAEADTLEKLYGKYDIPPAKIHKNGIKVGERERQFAGGRGMVIEFQVPFEGDGQFFNLCPRTCDVLPNVSVCPGYVGFAYAMHVGTPEQTGARFEHDLQRFEASLRTLVAEADQFNTRLRECLKRLIGDRQAELGNRRIDGLGYPRA